MNLFECYECGWPICAEKITECPRCKGEVLDHGEAPAYRNHNKLLEYVKQNKYAALIAAEEAQIAAKEAEIAAAYAEKAAEELKKLRWKVYIVTGWVVDGQFVKWNPKKCIEIGNKFDCTSNYNALEVSLKSPTILELVDPNEDVVSRVVLNLPPVFEVECDLDHYYDWG